MWKATWIFLYLLAVATMGQNLLFVTGELQSSVCRGDILGGAPIKAKGALSLKLLLILQELDVKSYFSAHSPGMHARAA